MEVQKRIMFVVFGACVVLMASGTLAQDRDKAEASPPITDEQFVLKASEGGMAEVNHGMLASKQAKSPDVKAFAQRMVKDHGQANKELLAVANKKGFKVAKDMGEKHKAMQAKLSKLTGDEF